MFWHIFKYRFLTSLRQKVIVFWSLLFPIILCTCFYVAFSSINDKAYTFHTIPVAVVYEEDDPLFAEVLKNVSDEADEKAFLKVFATDSIEAQKLLTDRKVDAIITVKDDPKLMVTSNGINQTAVASFLDQYTQKKALVADIINEHPEKASTLIASISDSTKYVQEKNFTDAKIDPLASYYFSLIGMAALFGGFFGMICSRQLTANTTPEGMRKCISPVKRGLLIFSEILSTYLIHLISMFLLILYMSLILKINLSGQWGYVTLTCVVGSFCGVSSGFFIGALSGLSEGAQTAVFLSGSLFSSFLSGLMVGDIKIWIQHNCPIITRINPATLISDSLYSLTIYNTHDRYFLNIILLGIISLIYCLLSFVLTRRKSYASI